MLLFFFYGIVPAHASGLLPQESERSIVKGGVPIGHGDYSLRQMTVIFKRKAGGAAATVSAPGEEDESKAKEISSGDGGVDGDDVEATFLEAREGAPAAEMAETTVMSEAAMKAAERVAERTALERASEKPPKLPEIILFWARSMRRGGNLVVCPNTQSMNRLIQAYLVCEVVQDSKLFDKSL